MTGTTEKAIALLKSWVYQSWKRETTWFNFYVRAPPCWRASSWDLWTPAGQPRWDQQEGEWPWPIMLCYQVKETLCAAREKGQISVKGAKIMIFPDYSKQVTDKRISFKQVKVNLRNRGVEYTFNFPATLKIKRNGAGHRFNTPEEASEFIKRQMGAREPGRTDSSA